MSYKKEENYLYRNERGVGQLAPDLKFGGKNASPKYPVVTFPRHIATAVSHAINNNNTKDKIDYGLNPTLKTRRGTICPA